MKNVLTVIGLAGLLALALTVRAFAAPTPQLQQAQAGAAALQQVTTTATTGQPVQSTPTAALPATVFPQEPNQTATVMPSGRGMGMRGGRMSGKMGSKRGRTGMRGGMMSGSGMIQGQNSNAANTGSSMSYEMMFGVAPMHNDVASQLGMTSQDLYNHMASGKSLVQIAAEKGITEQQLMDNIMAGRRSAYEQSVMEGRMTQAQADWMLMNVQDNLKSMVNGQGTGSTGWSMMWEAQP